MAVDADDLIINEHLAIPLEEIAFRYSRASGPGGQNVNRTASRVELLFDVAGSPCLAEHQRTLLQARLGAHLDGQGVLHLFSQETPSQWRNRQELLTRLQALLVASLRPRIYRRPTRPTAGSRERRLAAKRQHGVLKAGRRLRPQEE